MGVYLGLDCGGSTCRALALDDAGETVHESSAGPANLASTPEADLRTNLLLALEGCPKVDAAWAGFAGLLTDADHARAVALLQELVKAGVVGAGPDYFATVAAAPSDADVCVIAGTGSLVCSRQGAKIVKSGGGGPLLGDDGSAFGIARNMLRLCILTPEARTPPEFAEALGATFGTERPNDVLAAIYRGESPAARVASLAPAVFRCLDGTQEARRLADLAIDSGLAALATSVQEHVEHWLPNDERITVALAGGLWQIASDLPGQFEQALNLAGDVRAETIGRRRQYKSTGLEVAPVEGAVRLARELSV